MSFTLTTNPPASPVLKAVNSYIRIGRVLLAAFIVATIAATVGCSSAPTPVKTTPKVVVKETGTSVYQSALGLSSPQREQQLIKAAGLFNEEQFYQRSLDALAMIDEDRLPSYEYANYVVEGGKAALNLSKQPLAERYLLLPRSRQAAVSSSPAVRARILRLRGELYRRQGNNMAMLNDLTSAMQYASYEDKEATQEQLWRSVNRVPVSELKQIQAQGSQSQAVEAWVSLSVTARSNTEDLDQQLSSLDAWLARWGGTSIAADLPDDLSLLRQIAEERPQSMALWVPLTGKLASAGTTIRDGFMAAYYQGLQNASTTPQIQVFDSALPSNSYETVAAQTELVVGPLDKAKVTNLAMQGELSTPTLAINLPTQAPLFTDNLYFFGLDVESEAIQVARKAYNDGRRQALVFAPNASWGKRAASAFIDEWLTLGGTIADSQQYSVPSQYSKQVESLMGVNQSHQRAKTIRNIVGSAIDFRPQRRHDADMVFLLATPANARLLNPMFAYHYGGDLPVYATSQVFSGSINSKVDTDLNGIIFATMPWMHDTESSLYKSTQGSSESQYLSAKLYALGIDLYRLAPRLTQLAGISGAQLQGATGALSIVDGKVSREPAWAQFKQGRPRLLDQRW